MTGVILRCPNCGTSKSSPGECDACHEAQVRYYCTNHKPGVWLDAAACSQCGARFGDPVRAPERPIPPAASARPRTPSPSPTARRAESPPSPPKVRASPWGRRARVRSSDPEEIEAGGERAPVRDLRTARMLEILRAASRVGRMSRGVTYTTSEAPPVGAALGGCLMRLVILAIFFLVLVMLMLSFVGGSLLQMFGSFYF
jgi:hypothetical protein